MSKHKGMNNAFSWLFRNADESHGKGGIQIYGKIYGRRVRATDLDAWKKASPKVFESIFGKDHPAGIRIELGDNDFDRWANSCEREFTYDKTKNFQQQFMAEFAQLKA